MRERIRNDGTIWQRGEQECIKERERERERDIARVYLRAIKRAN